MSKLIRIKYYESPIEANRDKQILLENGIESFIANEQTIQSDWLLSQAIGGLQLQVFEEDVEKAKEILQNFEENEEVALEVEHTIENPEYDFTCPKCGRKHSFTRYIDTETNIYIDEKVGICNRAINCGYHYSPKKFIPSDRN